MRAPQPFSPITVLDTTIDLNWYIEVLFRHARMILGMGGIALALALFIFLLVVPQYTATSQILLDPRKQNILGPEAITSEFMVDAASFEGQIAIIKSRSFLMRVAEDEKLALEPGFGAAPPPSLLSQIKSQLSWMKSNDNGVGSTKTAVDPQQQLARGMNA